MERHKEITSLIEASFSVVHMELINESHMHSVPPNSETHFKLVLVSDDFEGESKVKRHQSVYRLVAPLMEQGLHALALHLYTPGEWQKQFGEVPSSPNCMGGSKADSKGA